MSLISRVVETECPNCGGFATTPVKIVGKSEKPIVMTCECSSCAHRWEAGGAMSAPASPLTPAQVAQIRTWIEHDPESRWGSETVAQLIATIEHLCAQPERAIAETQNTVRTKAAIHICATLRASREQEANEIGGTVPALREHYSYEGIATTAVEQAEALVAALEADQ